MYLRIRLRHRRRRSIDNIHMEVVRKASEVRNEKALNKLSLNIGTFVVAKLPILVVSACLACHVQLWVRFGMAKINPQAGKSSK